MYLFLVFAIFPNVIFGNNIQECPPCNCSILQWTKLTNAECSTLINLSGLTDIPKTIPDNINSINFNGQLFTILKNNSFSRFTNLTNIYFPNNKIEIIEENSLKNLTKLTILSLPQNKIKDLPAGVFSDLQQINTIYINNNKITVLSKGLFSNLPTLKMIYINGNAIITIKEDCFSNLPSLLVVNLAQNKLTTLNTKIIDNPDKLKYFDFYSNPWHCDETICPIMDSAKEDSFEFSYCKTPANLLHKSWSSLLDKFTLGISSKQNVDEGETALINCRYCFTSKVIWLLPSPSRNHTVEVSKVSLTSTLVLDNVTQKDTGYYRCHVEGCTTCTAGIFLNVHKRNEADTRDSIALLLQSTTTEIEKDNKHTPNHTSGLFLMAVLIITTMMVLALALYMYYYKIINPIFYTKKQQIILEHELPFLRGKDS